MALLTGAARSAKTILTRVRRLNRSSPLVLSQANLSAAAWVTNAPPQAITGAVTRVSVTNEARQEYFRVMAKPKGE